MNLLLLPSIVSARINDSWNPGRDGRTLLTRLRCSEIEEIFNSIPSHIEMVVGLRSRAAGNWRIITSLRPAKTNGSHNSTRPLCNYKNQFFVNVFNHARCCGNCLRKKNKNAKQATTNSRLVVKIGIELEYGF